MRRAFTLVVVVLLVAPLGAGIGAAAMTHPPTQTAAQATPSPVNSSYSISELRRQGSPPSTESPASVRKLDTYTSLALRYDGVGLLHQTDVFLDSGATVRSDQVHLDSIRYGRAESTETLVMVFWTPETRAVEAASGNGTTMQTVAANQTVRRQEITIPENRERATIDLPEHAASTHVTMWVDGHRDVRWTFQHHSVPFAQTLAITSQGGFWERALTQIAFPTLALGGLVGAVIPASIKRAGAGPQWGLLPWGVILAFAGFFGLLFASTWLSSVIVALPFVVPVAIAALVGIVFLERYEDGVHKVTLCQLDTTEKKTPSGDLALEALAGKLRTVKLTKTPNGRLAVIPTGLRAFIARVFGRAAILHGDDRIRSEVDLSDSDSDKLIFIDTDADELVDVNKESLEFRPPTRDQDGALDIGGVLGVLVEFAVPAAVFFLLSGPVIGIIAGLLAVLLLNTQAHEGSASILPAVGHAEDAVATAFYLEKSLEEYETFEGLIKALRSEKNRSEDILEMIEEQGAEALIDRAHGRQDAESLDEMWSDDAKGVSSD